MKAALPADKAAVEFDSATGLPEITPPPPIELKAAALPETTTEAAPCEPVPTATIEVSLATPGDASAPDDAEVGAGISLTPAPAVANAVSVAPAEVNPPLLPVPIAATEVG